MNDNNYNSPSAPSPLILPVAVQAISRNIDYHFIIKKRSFWCYKNYIKLKLDHNLYIIEYVNGILEIPKSKSKEYIIDILKTIGIKNKYIFKVFVMQDDIVLSSRNFYDLNSILNFVNKTEIIMENVKYQ